MARASFSALPLELKTRIVEMVSDQEDAWRGRIQLPSERAGHTNGLSSLALVNKALRELAAKHQFDVLFAHRASLPIFRYSILQRHGHHINEMVFYHFGESEGAELALSFMGQCPLLRILRFDNETAARLFGSGMTLRHDLEDEASSHRASLLALFAPKIETLTLLLFKPSETVALVRAFPNLKTLFLSLAEPEEDGQLHDVANAISSLSHLRELSITMDDDASAGWPTEALVPLARNPPPVRLLFLVDLPLHRHTLEFVAVFSSTIEYLSLDVTVEDPPIDETSSITPINLPRLTLLNLACPAESFPELTRILASTSSLSDLSHYSIAPDQAVAPSDPALLTFLDSQPSLRYLWLWDVALDPLPEGESTPPPSFLTAYADLIRSRNLEPIILDQPYLTPFHPNAKLDYTEGEHEYLTGSLRRTLEFGLLELDRMAAEGSVERAVGWIPMLEHLEAKRLAWKD